MRDKGVKMLNKTVTVRITKPIDAFDAKSGRKTLNAGLGNVSGVPGGRNVKTYVMGINYPLNFFIGKTIAVIKRHGNRGVAIVAAPKNAHFVNFEIENAVAFAEERGSYKLECLYESSCGAVVYRMINGVPRFLLIKNKRSSNWGFPKGHIEEGESPHETAAREVFEETGVRIDIVEGFSSKSEYIIGRKVQKEVRIFLAATKDTQTKIQRDEIEDYIWLPYEQASDALNFQNDKRILEKAYNFMLKEGIGYNEG